jgi:acetoin utilization deacetylase AcuC-like enzyme
MLTKYTYISSWLIRYLCGFHEQVYRPHKCTSEELSRFHSSDYVDFLSRVTPDLVKDCVPQMQKCKIHNEYHLILPSLNSTHLIPYTTTVNVGEYTDCPVFDGLYDFCQLYTGATIGNISMDTIFFFTPLLLASSLIYIFRVSSII